MRTFLWNFHKIPARIIITDLLGAPESEVERLRRRAWQELVILGKQMVRLRKLNRGDRRVTVEPGVHIECSITFEVKLANVIIGASEEIFLEEYTCWCCSSGLIAGIIEEIHERKTDEEATYIDDTSYYADIRLCQKLTQDDVKHTYITKRRSALGISLAEVSTQVGDRYFITDTIYDIPFTDRYRHMPGDLVMVMISPLYRFGDFVEDAASDLKGFLNPQLNYGIPAQAEGYPYSFTNDYINSQGYSCRITLDKELWGLNPAKTPFRILPINIDSCLAGLKRV